MTLAEAQALGLYSNNSSLAGYVGFSSSLPFGYSANATPAANQYYFIGVAEHEISEVMGRISLLNSQPQYYSPMDLYRYTAPGVRDLTTGGSGSTAYFSINNGTTNLGTWNNQTSNGDLGDWYPSGPVPGGHDAYNDYSNPGVINVISSNDITLMQALGWTTTQASQGPTVTSVVETPSTGDLNPGKAVMITLGLNGTVTVAGTPTLTLNDGGTATYTAGSGSNTLSFSYTVGATDSNVASLTVQSINFNGGAIHDGAGNNASLSLTGLTQSGPMIDTTVPAVTSVVETPGTGDLNAGKAVTITLDLSESVSVVGGTPTLILNDGGTASYSGGSGSNALTFAYTVLAGQNTNDLIVSSFNLNGATVTDIAGNNANLSGAINFNPAGVLQIDTTSPTMVSIAAATDNHLADLTAGHLVTITMGMSEAVTVTGTPTLQLSDHEVATYTTGSGSNTLTFNYVVQPGDNVTDLQVTGLNLASGAAIQDQAGNGLSGNVNGNLGLQINTTSIPPTSVQQEVLGLYATLYNRAAEFPGYSYWVGIDSQQSDAAGVTVTNATSTAVTSNDAQMLGRSFVNTESTFFNQTYGAMTDSQFINALYINIGGNAGDPGGMAYWTNLLQQAEAGGQSVQSARAGLVGQFVHDLIDVNLSTLTGLTTAQYQAAQQRQETIDNKIAVSLSYSNASQQPGGSILVPHTIGDAAYEAAVTILQGITYDPATATAAITGINNAVAHQDLLLI